MENRENWKEILSNYPYAIWVVFYACLFWLIFGANLHSFFVVLIIYVVCMVLACTPPAEWIYRKIQGVRPLATQKEKERLLPLFEEVYEQAQEVDENLSKNIGLYIQDSMEINAFAFGRHTVVITKGSMELLNDDEIKGLLAHELGHHSHYDTMALLFAYINSMD